MFRRCLPFAVLLAFLAPIVSAQTSADLFVAKNGPVTSSADSDVTYTITVTNGGPDTATTITLNDNTPQDNSVPTPFQMTFVSESHDPAFSCSTPSVGGTGTVSCTAPTLAAGASANFTFTFHIPPGTPAGATFTNIATISSDSDPNDENNSSSAVTSTPPPPSSDLGVTKTGPSAAGPDTDVTYTITFFNAGPDADSEATLTDTLPGTMTYVSHTQQSGPALNCNFAGGTLTCTASPFAAGASATILLTGHIPAGTPSGTIFSNTATATGSNDLNPENNEGVTALTVSSVDVGVTKTGPPSVTAGNTATYTITVTNSGDSASGVTLSDNLPPGTTFVSWTQDTGVATSCSTPSPGANGSIFCTFQNLLPNGSSAQFTLVVNVGDTTSIANTAVVSTDSFDSNNANDSSTANTTVTPSSDLSVTKTGPATMTAGTNATYTIAVSNGGPSTATSVQLTDTLPAGTTFVSLTQTSGPTFNCTTGATITCTIASLAPAASATFDAVVAVASSAANASTVTNTAVVSSAVTDPTPGNNSSTTAPATVATSADLSVTKSGPAAVAPGSDITYTVNVTNSGPSDAAAVVLTDTTPAGTTFVSGNQTGGPTFNCTYPAPGGTGTINCTIASLVSGASATFTFVFNVTPTTTGTISNTAGVSSTTPDPNAGNASSTSPAVVSPATTDVSITKTANGTRFPSGGNVTYTIVATNNGPAIATNVVVTDVLPAGTTLVSATPTQGSCTGTTTVTCNAGLLLSGDAVTITLVVTLPTAFGPVSNTATVTSDNADSNPGNNAATAALAVATEIPSLSPLALALLAMALAGVSVLVMKGR